MQLTNAVIWTGDPARPWAESMVVENGRVKSVGSGGEDHEAIPLDLGGAFVCPGLIDAHAHVLGFGRGRTRVDLTGARSLPEALDRVEIQVGAKKERGENGWIRGRGWGGFGRRSTSRMPDSRPVPILPHAAKLRDNPRRAAGFWVRAWILATLGKKEASMHCRRPGSRGCALEPPPRTVWVILPNTSGPVYPGFGGREGPCSLRTR